MKKEIIHTTIFLFLTLSIHPGGLTTKKSSVKNFSTTINLENRSKAPRLLKSREKKPSIDISRTKHPHDRYTQEIDQKLAQSTFLQRLPQFYFSEMIEPALQELIALEDEEIAGAFFHFHNTRPCSLTQTWADTLTAKPNLKSTLIVDWKLIDPAQADRHNHPATICNTAMALLMLQRQGAKITCNNDKKGYQNQPATQHNKILLLKKLNIVVTGSWNNTPSAAHHNWENMVILRDALLYRQAYKEFKRLLRHSREITPQELEKNQVLYDASKTTTLKQTVSAVSHQSYIKGSYEEMARYFDKKT